MRRKKEVNSNRKRHYRLVRHYSFTIRGVSHLPYFGFKIRRRYNLMRHKRIIKILTPLFDEVMQITNQKSKQNNVLNGNSYDTIWFFWWQGKDQITDLSNKCYKSLLKNKGKRKVVFISKNNFQEYAKLPDYIVEKFEAGLITKTHFSDILRFNLLRNYGGLWVDATLYFTASLDMFKTQELITCSGYPDELKYNIAYGRWTGFFIGGPREIDIFSFMDNFFLEYWKQNDYLIDYYLIDYALHYAWQKNLSAFRDICKKNSGKQPRLFDLQSKLGEDYDSSQWEALKEKTCVFKLSNKMNFRRGKGTLYYKL